MAKTRMVSYWQWKNSIVKKGFSESLWQGDTSYPYMKRLLNTIVLEEQGEGVRQEVRLTMLHYDKEKKLIQHLIKMCKKANIFRKNRVEEIQQQIKSNTYKVTGEDVAKKWFHEDAE